MAVHFAMTTMIIPRTCVDAVYPGGFEQFKLDRIEIWDSGFWEHQLSMIDKFQYFDDNIVIVDINMDGGAGGDIGWNFDYWSEFGLDPLTHIGVVFTDPKTGLGITNCPWLEVDDDTRMISSSGNLPKFE